MKRKPTLFVSLTGGLGNQLFLLAAGLKHAMDRPVVLVSDFGAPRVTKEGATEIHSFELPKTVHQHPSSKSNWLIKKAVGFTLRSSLYPNALENKFRIPSFSRFLTSILVSLKLRTAVTVTTSKSIDNSRTRLTHSELLVGYFQDRISAFDPIVHKTLMEMKPKELPPEFGLFISESNSLKKLVVHIRLGDYRNESSFGILPESYYHNAIERFFKMEQFDEIWLFSDEPESCINYIPEHLRKIHRIMNNFQEDSSLTIEMMRHGDGFIIANSTFSWWAASLAYNKEARVIYPTPWFESRSTSEFLIPTNWLPGDR